MKPSQLIFFLLLIAAPCRLLAQTPAAIEAGLLNSFKKITYWSRTENNDAGGSGDSLEKANDKFGEKLKAVTIKYPATLTQSFPLLDKEGLDIFSSTDGMFRIYSWDTWTGGTMHYFANLLQYKAAQQTRSVLLISTEEMYVPFYSNLYTFKTGGQTYYIGIYGGIYSSKDASSGVKIFSIENGKLNSDVKLLKTGSGLKNQIAYNYDFSSIAYIPYGKRPTITFDPASQTIHLPLVDAKGNVTKKFITYKFTGQYFEKVSNLAK